MEPLKRILRVCFHPALAPALLLLFAGCGTRPLQVPGGILGKETRWSGRVEVRGVVLVERDAHLRIDPGTEVVFLWVDEDGDGIGDGQLNVLGRLTAVGTQEKPVIFRGEKAQRKGWTFLHLTGNADSRIEYCVFRDAFTGVQLHYVQARLRNCLFTDNHEGLRYSTIRGRIEHNVFRDNGVALRFEGRETVVDVERNLFRGNGVAVFAVTRGGAGDRFRHNDFQSLDYNVKLGFEQRGSLDFSENWWGTTDPGKVQDTIFDGRDDPLLGEVAVDPLLPSPPQGAGTELPLSYPASPDAGL